MEILIAEDELVAQSILQNMLEKWDHQVLSADDGKQAWDIFQKHNVKMVITDWIMPKMDGLELCRKIRKANLSEYVYIIILTSRDEKSDTVLGLKAGADDFMMKPLEPEELKARIRTGQRIFQLEDAREKTRMHLLQSEKMASMGQLAAGVAHEINNPTGFVNSNLTTLLDYQNDLKQLIELYRQLISGLNENLGKIDPVFPISKQIKAILDLEDQVDVTFILNDFKDIIEDCQEGTGRIKKIVVDLKDFAHPGKSKKQLVDINNCLESTLNVVWNELKYKAKVKKDYSKLPLIQCYPQKLNQVFMNLLINAGHAIEKQGQITIQTKNLDGYIQILISDTGCGIPQEIIPKIFDPFFTTKDIGQGTGLGLNVAYNIIKEHKGTIQAKSQPGQGTTFHIQIPAEEEPEETG